MGDIVATSMAAEEERPMKLHPPMTDFRFGRASRASAACRPDRWSAGRSGWRGLGPFQTAPFARAPLPAAHGFQPLFPCRSAARGGAPERFLIPAKPTQSLIWAVFFARLFANRITARGRRPGQIRARQIRESRRGSVAMALALIGRTPTAISSSGPRHSATPTRTGRR